MQLNEKSRPNPYLKYNLTRNPFPAIPITSTWSDQPFFKQIFQEELSYLEKIIKNQLNENLKIFYILGERGCGKSALLKFFLRKVCSSLKELTPIYAKFGSSHSFAPLYNSAISWLGNDFIQKLCIRKFSRGILHGRFSDFIWHPSRAYVNLLFEGDRAKFPVFIMLLNMIRDDSKVLLGIDGLDNTFEDLSQMQRIDIIYGFNRLIDGVSEDIILFLTINSHILRWLKINQMTLESLNIRPLFIEPEVLSVKRLNLTKACELIIQFLKMYRIRDSFKDELFPFTEKAIRLIHEASEGNMRKFLIFCRDLLGFSIGMNYNRIDKNVAYEYLSLGI
jgi:hypothetical protein